MRAWKIFVELVRKEEKQSSTKVRQEQRLQALEVTHAPTAQPAMAQVLHCFSHIIISQR